jgi:cytochrome c553
MKRTGILLAFVLGAIFTGCYNDKYNELYPQAATCDTANVTYTATIKPIIAQNCATTGCHDATTKESGYDMSVYADLKVAVDNNKLLAVINHQSGVQPMPQGLPKLSDCNIAKITKWVSAGAPNN